jgi:hypothetical protein
MVDGRLSADTAPEIEERQIAAWRAMSDGEKLQLVLRMSATVRQLTLAGVEQRYPDASPRERFLRVAQITLGDDLARRAYPDLDHLGPL